MEEEGKHLPGEMEERSPWGMEGSPLGVEAVAADRAGSELPGGAQPRYGAHPRFVDAGKGTLSLG